MKSILILLLFLAVIATVLILTNRRQSPVLNRSQAISLLRSHLAEGRDYKYFVGVPLNAPKEWKQAKTVGKTLSIENDQVDLDEIMAFIVAYPNGKVLSAHREFFPLPEGTKFIETKLTPRKDILDLSMLKEGSAFVKISYSPSSSQRIKSDHYSTSIRNISDQKIRVIKFGGFTKSGEVYRLNTISGDYFPADDFINWYDAPKNGWLQPGTTVSDPNNYGGGNGYWVYYFETEDGKKFAAGAKHPK